DPPPTYDDILGYFRTSGIKYKSGSMVFWSGVTVSESQNFARSMGRLTLEMLIDGKWEEYKAVGPYWKTWEDAVDGFWIPASKAAADFAARDVLVYLSPDADKNKQPNACDKVFVKIERPALIDGLNTGRVSIPALPGRSMLGIKTAAAIAVPQTALVTGVDARASTGWTARRGTARRTGTPAAPVLACAGQRTEHAMRTGALAETNSEARQEYALRETTTAAGARASVVAQTDLATHTAVRGRTVDAPPGTIMAVLATPEHPGERERETRGVTKLGVCEPSMIRRIGSGARQHLQPLR
ncbi:hypothetical protein GP486_000260, partial [Trichoglossum hirsutum]